VYRQERNWFAAAALQVLVLRYSPAAPSSRRYYSPSGAPSCRYSPAAPSRNKQLAHQCPSVTLLLMMLLLLAHHHACACATTGVDCSLAAAPTCTPQGIYTSRNDSDGVVAAGAAVPRVLYAEHFGKPADDWGDRINLAIQAGFAAGAAAVELPIGVLDVAVPIKLWRLRQTSHADTTADSVASFAHIGQVWEAVKGGAPSDLARGFQLRGAAGGGYASQPASTRLRWAGSNDSVMLDMPAPWHCKVSDLMLDGNQTGGLIGIRYRAGYEFGVNGGKANVFERLSIFSMHVAIEVGGPLIPDLVGSSFRNLEIHDVRVCG
jgi:hypothetical protein